MNKRIRISSTIIMCKFIYIFLLLSLSTCVFANNECENHRALKRQLKKEQIRSTKRINPQELLELAYNQYEKLLKINPTQLKKDCSYLEIVTRKEYIEKLLEKNTKIDSISIRIKTYNLLCEMYKNIGEKYLSIEVTNVEEYDFKEFEIVKNYKACINIYDTSVEFLSLKIKDIDSALIDTLISYEIKRFNSIFYLIEKWSFIEEDCRDYHKCFGCCEGEGYLELYDYITVLLKKAQSKYQSKHSYKELLEPYLKIKYYELCRDSTGCY